MRLHNNREPYDDIEELHPDRIAFLMDHGYVEVKGTEAPRGFLKTDDGRLVDARTAQQTAEDEQREAEKPKGRKAKQEPPSDIGALADEISKSGDDE